MLEKIRNNILAYAGASLIGLSSIMSSCSSHDKTIDNKNTYILTVNDQNTGVLKKLGWTRNDSKKKDYAIYKESLQEFRNEFNENYAILTITGHHNYLGRSIYGEHNQEIELKDLPKSKNLEAVLFSACTTAGIDKNIVENIYIPLIKKYPNLKVITGFKETSLKDDGVTPKLLSSTTKYMLDDITKYAQKSIQVNPKRVGTLVKKGRNKWDYYSNEGVVHMKIAGNKYKILN